MYKKFIAAINAILFLLVLVISSALSLPSLQLHADEIDLNGKQLDGFPPISAVVTILSAEPSTGGVTTIEASGTWRSGCVPELGSVEFSSSEVGNGILHISAIAEPAGFVCGQSETEWSFPVEVQFELPGAYTVQLFITSEQFDTTDLYASKELFVAGHLGFSPQMRGADQSITLTVTGVHDDDCVPEYVSYEIIDDTIVVEIMTPDSAEIVCEQSISPWQIEVEMTDLDDGGYVVEVYSANQYEGAVTDRTMYKTATLSVGTATGQAVDNFVYLPNIIQAN